MDYRGGRLQRPLSVEERLNNIENVLSDVVKTLVKLKKSVENPPRYSWLGERYN